MSQLFKKIEEIINHPPIKWLALSGAYTEIVEERHIKLILPVKDLHMNHVNIVYAGSMFAFAEMGGYALFLSTHGFDKYVPVIKSSQIRYLKPTRNNLIIDIRLSEDEAAEKIKPIEERGRGDYFLTIPVKDIDGAEVAIAEMNYYLLPYTNTMMMKSN